MRAEEDITAISDTVVDIKNTLATITLGELLTAVRPGDQRLVRWR